MDLGLASLIANGVALGAAYALTAVGFVLIINAVGAVNFAQGDFVMAGGFLAVFAASLLPETVPVPGLLLLPLILTAAAVIGVLFSLIAYQPVQSRPPTTFFITTIACGLILQHGAQALFGPDPRAGPPLVGGGSIEIAGFALSVQQIAVIIVAGLVLGGLHYLMAKTQTGRHMRAAAQNREAAEAMGVDTGRIIAIGFALAIALAAIAGLLLSNQFFVTPTDGGEFMLKAYIATVIGGWGRIKGAALGALLIGLFETVVAGFVSYVFAEALLYAGLLLILFVQPEGLFGEALGRRA